MSDETTITSGGAIAVDSGLVRDIARRLRGAGRQLADACDLVRRAGHALDQAPEVQQRSGSTGIADCVRGLERIAPVVDDIAHGATVMADTFELVELRAQQDALNTLDPPAAAALQKRIDQLVQSDPGIEDRVRWLEADWLSHRHDGLGDQPLDTWFGPLITTLVAGIVSGPAGALGLPPASLVAGFLGTRPVENALRGSVDLVDRLGTGALPPAARLTGAAPPVTVELIAKGTASAPASLKDSIERIPNGGTGQIVVEKYTMKDGTRRFLAYLDGTRTVMPFTGEPWDMGSNWDMYVDREPGASQQAAMKALEAAGAQPGDRVDYTTYSQGGVIASYAAGADRYETTTLITAGNPVEPWLTADQTHVALVHEGDYVANLAGGGTMGASGSPESFTVTRDPDSFLFWNDHDLAEYVETAARADSSRDPRVRALHEDFYAELAKAETVERLEFKAARP